MKNFHKNAKRLFSRPERIERICTEALQATGFYPAQPGPIRIDRFVEVKFKIGIDYQELDSGILGYTVFNNKGVERIVVSTSFDEDGSVPAGRRLRSTLAHEAGHGLLHTSLFTESDQQKEEAPKIMCRTAEPEITEWGEYQANQAIGYLLLPRELVKTALDGILEDIGLSKIKTLTKDRKESAIAIISESFDVNPQVAKIRLEGIFPSLASGLE